MTIVKTTFCSPKTFVFHIIECDVFHYDLTRCLAGHGFYSDI